ncbi:MAG TPA: aminodeoxychorismate synthase component I [Trichocoleus sp.]|jgi:para-aminobenzoate synthetase/4-amino-4-deoxychorismate lyase
MPNQGIQLSSDQSFADNSVLLHHAKQQQWLLFREPIALYQASQPEEVIPLLEAIEQRVDAEQLYAAGFLAYEAAAGFDPNLVVRSSNDAFPLVWFGLYQSPTPVELPQFKKSSCPTLDWQSSITNDTYQAAIHQIKNYIRSGDTYQVNYSFRLRSDCNFDAWNLFLHLVQAQGAGYSAYVQTPDWLICSASPELFFTLEGNELISRPMKGTVARGLWQAQDDQQASWLRQSTKNQAENLMIVDMVRNDMGQIAETGTVKVPELFELEQYPTLWQMTSTVQCTAKASFTEMMRSMFPAASITGAPKTRTMEIISELEDSPRKIYTGSLGFLAPKRKAQFNVAIRTLLIERQKSTAEYGIGGGIVWDSAEDTELAECYTKAKILTQSLPEFSLLETLLWTPTEGYFLLDYHLARLQNSAAYFSYSIDLEAIRQALISFPIHLTAPHRIRLLISQQGKIVIEQQPWIQTVQTVRLALAKIPIDSTNPFLYHKTTHRSIYEQMKQTCPDAEDVLLWNERGEITESCIANVVIEQNGELFTPPIESGLLAGTYRAYLLEQRKIQEKVISLTDLLSCTQIYLINSVRKLTLAELQPSVS